MDKVDQKIKKSSVAKVALSLKEYRSIMFQLKASLNNDGLFDDRVQRLYEGLVFMCDSYEKLQLMNEEMLDSFASLTKKMALIEGKTNG